MVVLEEEQTGLEWILTQAGSLNEHEEVFVTVDEFGLFSALNKSE